MAAGVPVVHDAVRARRADRLVPGAVRAAAARRSRPSRCSPRSRPSRTTRTGMPSRARSCTSCGPARWPAPASCRSGPTTARSMPRRCGSILFAATFDWTGDRDLVDRLWPNALRALDWIDTYGDRDGDGFVEYERRTPRGPRQPGLEGLGRRRSATGTGGWRRRRSRWPRSRATCSTPSPARPARAHARRGGPRPPPGGGRRDPAPPVRGVVLVRGPGVLRDGAGRREAAGGRDRVQRRPLPVVRDRLARPGPARRRPADGARHVQRLGHPDLLLGPGRLQPHRLPLGHRLAARRVADRGRLQALRPARGGEPAGRPDLRGRAALRRLPAARAVLRLRPRPFAGPRPVSGRLLAAGLGRGLAVPVPRDDAGPAPARRPPRAGAASGRSCPTGCRRSRSRTCASATARWTCCSIAGAAAPPRRSCARAATSTSPSGCSAVADAAPTVAELVRVATERIAASGSGSARLDAELLLGQTLGIDRTGILAHGDAPVGPDARQAFEVAVERRERGEPVAYIRGFREFHGLAFATDARALIPRPETELLVDAALAEIVARLTATPRGPRRAGAAGRRRRDGDRRDRDLAAGGAAPPEDGRPGARDRRRRLDGRPPARPRERRGPRRRRPDGVRRGRPAPVPRRAAVRGRVREPPVRAQRRPAAAVAGDRLRAARPRSTAAPTASTSCGG